MPAAFPEALVQCRREPGVCLGHLVRQDQRREGPAKKASLFSTLEYPSPAWHELQAVWEGSQAFDGGATLRGLVLDSESGLLVGGGRSCCVGEVLAGNPGPPREEVAK